MPNTNDEGEPKRPFNDLRAFWKRLQAEDLPRLFLYFVTLLGLAAFWIVYFERGKNPAFQDYGDGLWWALVTVTTIGYGDFYPVTTAGRIVASILILFGVGLFGPFSGLITSWFIGQKHIK